VAWLVPTWVNEQRVDTHVAWSWEGDEEAIEYFGVHYSCGGLPGAGLHARPDDRRISVHWVDPRCNETCEFHVTGYGTGGLIATPRSNTVSWEGEECARGRTVTIGFETFRPIPVVDGRGPIYGSFSANEEVLSFDGADSSICDFYGYECGYYAHYITGGYLTVGELFHTIREMLARCGSCSYGAPSSTYVMVPVPEGDDLTIGFEIWEYHREGEDVLLCRGRSSFEYDELRDREAYVFPSYDLEVPCRVEVSMHVWEWTGG
jgi:hypothetical protein